MSTVLDARTPLERSPQFLRGAIGELAALELLRSRGYIVYSPGRGVAHPFDYLVTAPTQKRIFACEVKTKAARRKYPDTGIDERLRRRYHALLKRYNLELYLIFCDPQRGAAYGNWLSLLEERRTIEHEGATLAYPWVSGGICYYPLDAMRDLGALPQRHITAISEVRAYG